MVGLRTAVGDDAETVARIYIESWNDGFGHLLGVRRLDADVIERWRRALTVDDGNWTVAELDGIVVGIVGVGPSRDPIDPALGELDTIAVDPAHWRIGVGRRLMDHALGVLRVSWSQAILWTPENHERGHAFYRATGWIALGRSRRDGTEVAFGRRL